MSINSPASNRYNGAFAVQQNGVYTIHTQNKPNQVLTHAPHVSEDMPVLNQDQYHALKDDSQALAAVLDVKQKAIQQRYQDQSESGLFLVTSPAGLQLRSLQDPEKTIKMLHHTPPHLRVLERREFALLKNDPAALRRAVASPEQETKSWWQRFTSAISGKPVTTAPIADQLADGLIQMTLAADRLQRLFGVPERSAEKSNMIAEAGHTLEDTSAALNAMLYSTDFRAVFAAAAPAEKETLRGHIERFHAAMVPMRGSSYSKSEFPDLNRNLNDLYANLTHALDQMNQVAQGVPTSNLENARLGMFGKK